MKTVFAFFMVMLTASWTHSIAQMSTNEGITTTIRNIETNFGSVMHGRVIRHEIRTQVGGLSAIVYMYLPRSGPKLVLTGAPQNVAEMLRQECPGGVSRSSLNDHIADIWTFCLSGDPYVKVVTKQVAASVLDHIVNTEQNSDKMLLRELMESPSLIINENQWRCSLETLAADGSIEVVNIDGSLNPFRIFTVSSYRISERGFFAVRTRQSIEAAIAAKRSVWLNQHPTIQPK